MTTEEKQAYIISLLKPYFLDISIRGFGLREGREYPQCVYLAPNGNKCAFGQTIDPEQYDKDMEGCVASNILDQYVDCQLPEHKGKLNPTEWNYVQRIHDWMNDEVETYSHIYRCESQLGISLSELKSLVPSVTEQFANAQSN